MNKIKLLVFPCGSEVGLEIHRSLEYSRHIELWGGSSVNDHGKFVYENYIGGIPFITDRNFIDKFKIIIKKNNFDAIYPSMDSVISLLKSIEAKLECTVISSPSKTTEICLSKKRTYAILKNTIKVPLLYDSLDIVSKYPIFIKPVSAYGSRGAKIIYSPDEGLAHLREWDNCIICEYLPGEEYTVDCFTDKNRQLLFSGPRIRRRTKNGISVNTISIPQINRQEFETIANKINSTLVFRGAWFFQVKRNTLNDLVLLEVASRLGGSSLLYRLKGVNFSLLSVFDAFSYKVSIIENSFGIEIDRALDHKIILEYQFNTVYVDFDDCLYIEEKINYILVGRLYQFINEGKKIILITKHGPKINETLKKLRLQGLFDKIIQLEQDEKKSDYINNNEAIFIDDSYSERLDVSNVHAIPVFSPDMMNY